jgi:hypothetical protein
MIGTIWEYIVETMTGLGYRLDSTEADSLQDRHYTIALPSVQRKTDSSTFARLRVARSVQIRLQFRERKDACFQRDITKEIEQVATTVRSVLLFESSSLIGRAGGMVAEIQFTAIDSMN